MKKNQLLLLLALTGIFSCGKTECHNTNPVFESNPPASAPYKKELARLITAAKPGDISFYLKGYTDTDTTDYLLLDVTGKDFCATATVALAGNDAAAGQLRETKGKGYTGAELEGLKVEAGPEGNLVYNSCDRITD